jgi:penicillin-binding protein 1A
MKKKKIFKVVLFLTLLGMVLGAVTLLGAYHYFGKNLPSIDTLEDAHYQEPLRVYSSDNKLIAEFGDKRRIPKTYKEMPKQLIDAFIAAEDNRYWDHFGIDLRGTLRASLVYLWTGKKKQGASTITMQVARNFFLTPEKTLKRKIKEMFIAINKEKKFS